MIDSVTRFMQLIHYFHQGRKQVWYILNPLVVNSLRKARRFPGKFCIIEIIKYTWSIVLSRFNFNSFWVLLTCDRSSLNPISVKAIKTSVKYVKPSAKRSKHSELRQPFTLTKEAYDPKERSDSKKRSSSKKRSKWKGNRRPSIPDRYTLKNKISKLKQSKDQSSERNNLISIKISLAIYIFLYQNAFMPKK